MSSHSSDWPPTADVWHPLPDIQPQQGDNRNNNPKRVMFPDNEVVAITRWNQVLVQVVKWLTDNGHLDGNDCPIRNPDRPDDRYLVHIEPIHPKGDAFNRIRRKEVNSLYIETHHTAPKVVRNAIEIIDDVGRDAAQFKVRW